MLKVIVITVITVDMDEGTRVCVWYCMLLSTGCTMHAPYKRDTT